MVKINRPWTGKKDSLPDNKKKEQHKDRVSKKARIYELQQEEWEKEVKDFASKQIQE